MWVFLVGFAWDVGYGVVCCFEGAFAVPVVARAVFVPEGIVDGARYLALPKGSVNFVGVWGSCWHPSKVGENVLIALEV